MAFDGHGKRRHGMEGRIRLLEAALPLFRQQGIDGTGVDEIAKAAGLSKSAVYYHYASKRDLVLACLMHADDPALALLQGFARRREGDGDHPYERVLDGLERWIRSGHFQGCAYLAAAKALPEDREVIALALAHKRRTREWLAALVAAEGHPQAERAAGQFLLILDSVLGSGHLYPAGDLLDRARLALAPLVDETSPANATSEDPPTAESEDDPVLPAE